MLAFVDQSTNIKVFRIGNDPDGRVTRERLGVVRKRDFSLDEALETLPPSDKSSIAEMVAFYNEGGNFETLAALHSLPCTLRKVVDHVTTSGSKFQRDMVMMSLVESLRVLRKHDSENGRSPD